MAETLMKQRRGKNLSETERMASVIGGGALVAFGLVRRRWDGLALAALGGTLVYRGATGHCDLYQAFGVNTAKRSGRSVSIPYELGIRVDQSIIIDKTPEEVYRFWRNLENLPKFMTNVESVREIDNKHSHWVVKGPGGASVEWEAEVINEKENELIGWRSLSGSQVGQRRIGALHPGRGRRDRGDHRTAIRTAGWIRRRYGGQDDGAGSGQADRGGPAAPETTDGNRRDCETAQAVKEGLEPRCSGDGIRGFVPGE